MPELQTWLAYVATVLLLMSTPGPSQLLMLSNSAANGLRRGMYTAAGDLAANFLQMLAAGLGLASLIAASAWSLTVIKWLGVGYLIWLGLRMIRRAGGRHEMTEVKAAGRRTLWMQGFITSAANPKAVVFFAALFPQFLDPVIAFWPQFAVLSVTYLVLDGLFLTAYGAASAWVTARLNTPGTQGWVDRAGGGLMIAAVVLLGLKSAQDVRV